MENKIQTKSEIRVETNFNKNFDFNSLDFTKQAYKSNLSSQLKAMKNASISLRNLSSEKKNSVLRRLSFLLKDHQTQIIEANQADLENCRKNFPEKNSSAFLERLTLNPKRLEQMQESLQSIINAKDFVGEIVEESQLANGLLLKKLRAPLGLVFMIFESRPNVITEAFSIAFKSGNAFLMKGGKESDQTASYLYNLIYQSLRDKNLPESIFWGLSQAPREVTDFLMKQNKDIDVLIPRGGDHLIDYVTKNSTIPLIKNDRGLCHIYVNEFADEEMALRIIDNAKTQRPGVCNAMETLLVDSSIAKTFLPKVYERLSSKKVSFYLCEESYSFFKKRTSLEAVQSQVPFFYLAKSEDFDREYLDLIMNVKVVNNLNEALNHIELHGSHHSEAIITEQKSTADQFLNQVDAAVVYWNASTRFTDGYEFALGGEIGISTQKLHARGPVSLKELTSTRWTVIGQGQTRS